MARIVRGQREERAGEGSASEVQRRAAAHYRAAVGIVGEGDGSERAPDSLPYALARLADWRAEALETTPALRGEPAPALPAAPGIELPSIDWEVPPLAR